MTPKRSITQEQIKLLNALNRASKKLLKTNKGFIGLQLVGSRSVSAHRGLSTFWPRGSDIDVVVWSLEPIDTTRVGKLLVRELEQSDVIFRPIDIFYHNPDVVVEGIKAVTFRKLLGNRRSVNLFLKDLREERSHTPMLLSTFADPLNKAYLILNPGLFFGNKKRINTFKTKLMQTIRNSFFPKRYLIGEILTDIQAFIREGAVVRWEDREIMDKGWVGFYQNLRGKK